MKKEISITEMGWGNILIGQYELGNGIAHKAVAIRWLSSANFNCLGSVNPGGWLVINCKSGLAYLFQGKGLLVDRYIQEKLGGLPGDYPYFGDLVRELISRHVLFHYP